MGATGRFFVFDISSKVVVACDDDGAALWFLALTNTTPITIRIIAAATMIALRMESSSWGAGGVVRPATACLGRVRPCIGSTVVNIKEPDWT
jgi:hypothetical protein